MANFAVKNFIPRHEAQKFIREVVDAAFDKDGNYDPESKDFAMRKATLKYFTDLKVPGNSAAAYEFCYGKEPYYSDARDVLVEEYQSQYWMIDVAIDEMISDRRQAAPTGKLLNTINGFIEGVASPAALADLEKMLNQLNSLDGEALAVKLVGE